MKLLICAGGTGGGVYPALSVLHALNSKVSTLESLWVGGVGGMEADLVNRAGLSFEAIPAAGVHGVGLKALPGNLWQLGRGLTASRQILRRFQPNVLFFTGGFVGVPMGLASRLPGLGFRRPRNILYVPDIEPGLALKVLVRFADQVAITTDDTRAFLPSKAAVTLTGYPVRATLQPLPVQEARRQLGLNDSLSTLLVTGGSKGARSINRALLPLLADLLKEMQIIHISGELDWQEVRAARQLLPPELAERYHAFAYLHEDLGAAYSSADLIITRSGASTLGELPLFGLPAILVPYPYAWRYQRVNADYLARRGAAIVVENDELDSRLFTLIHDLMNAPEQRAKMRVAMQALAHPEASQAIAELVCALAPEEN